MAELLDRYTCCQTGCVDTFIYLHYTRLYIETREYKPPTSDRQPVFDNERELEAVVACGAVVVLYIWHKGKAHADRNINIALWWMHRPATAVGGNEVTA